MTHTYIVVCFNFPQPPESEGEGRMGGLWLDSAWDDEEQAERRRCALLTAEAGGPDDSWVETFPIGEVHPSLLLTVEKDELVIFCNHEETN